MPDVEYLGIKIALDPSAFKDGLNQVKAGIEQVEAGIEAFGSAVEDAGRSARQAGATGGDAMNQMAAKTQQVGKEADKANSKLRSLTDSWASKVKGFVTGVVAPMAGMFAIGGMAAGYMADIAKVAEQTGVYNAKLEEERKKKALLQRVTKEDLELYRKSRMAMTNFQLAAQSVGNAFMRTFGPALMYAAELLQKVGDWVSRNEANIVRFLQVVAGVITAVMIPALMRMAAAMLANPLTWIMALLVGLALVIDDLIVYMQGGESALADFWSMFGTGEEISKALSETWEQLKLIGTAAFEALIAVGKKLWSYFSGVIEPLKGIFKSLIQLLNGIIHGDGAAIWNALKSLASNLVQYMLAMFNGLFNLLGDIVKAGVEKVGELLSELGTWITEKLSAAWESLKISCSEAWEAVKSIVSEKINGVISALSNFASSILTAVENAWNSVKTSATAAWENVKATITEKINGVVNAVTNFGSTITSAFQNAWNSVLSYLGSLSLVESGKKLIQTFIDGILSMANSLVDSVKGVFKSVREYLPFSDAHEGPFADLTLSGERLMQTLGTGAEQGGSSLMDAVSGVFDGVKKSLSGAKQGGGLMDSVNAMFANVGKSIGGMASGLGGVATPALAMAGGSTTTVSTSIGQITVNTQATDAQGIAGSLGSAIKSNSSFGGLVPAAQTGVIQK